LAGVWGQMGRYFFVFACIDRYTLTSANTRIRAVSGPSAARWSLGIATLLWYIIIQRHDRDLLIMVLTEIIAYLILCMLYPCIVLEMSISNYLVIEKSLQRQQIENFVLFVGQFLLNVTSVVYLLCGIESFS